MHSFLDKYTVIVSAILLRNRKWFKENISSPGFAEQLDNIELLLPEINGEGFYELRAKTSVGVLDPAFHIVRWLGPEYPTVIYHHGNNERPFNYGVTNKNTFKSIFVPKKDMFQANLISLRAPFHNQSLNYYLDKMTNLANFTSLISVSVKLVEALVQHFKNNGSKSVFITGVSLGGWVTNLHRSFYNSADIYLPIFAGAALDELFLTSYYRKLVGNLASENPELVRKALNFESDFNKIKDYNVFPLLARYDRFIEYERQRQCYGDTKIVVIDKGHITGTLASGVIRKHILSHLGQQTPTKS